MSEPEDRPPAGVAADLDGETCDEIAAFLTGLRAAAHSPSYAELVRRVMRQRMARGMSEWEARVGRTTVYDAFRPGRRMLDLDLITELVRALGGSEEELADRLGRPTSRDRRVARPGVGGSIPLDEAPGGAAENPVAARVESLARPELGAALRLTLCLGCVAINLSGRILVNTTHVPLYLDMVGTAISAIILGPWWGAGVGLSTSLAGVATNGWISAGFVPVEVIGALIWGYGVRKCHLGRTVPRFLMLSVLVAVCCTIVAVPIIVWGDQGLTGSGADQLTRTMDAFWHSLFAAVASQNLLTSLADKLISGFIALAVAESLSARVAHAPRVRVVRSPWMRVSRGLPQAPATPS